MRTKQEVKDVIIKDFLNYIEKYDGTKYGGYDHDFYFQAHIDNIDKVANEYIPKLINIIIDRAISAYRKNGTVYGKESERTIFGDGLNYVRILGLSPEDLGDFYKNPTNDNIDKFIESMNKQFEIEMPTRTEYETIKNKYLNNPSDTNILYVFEEIKRKNGERIGLGGQYGDKYLEEFGIEPATKKI